MKTIEAVAPTMTITGPTLRISVPARAENIAVIRQALAGLAAELGAEADLIDDIKTAVSEAATNVILHAYPDQAEGPLEVTATLLGQRRLEIRVRDSGIGMQPKAVATEEPSLRVGLALIGAVADGFEIRGEKDEGTEVCITFDLDRSGGAEALLGPVGDVEDVDQTRVQVRGAEPGGAAIPKVLELLAARSNLSLDRLSDTQLLGDFLAFWNSHDSRGGGTLEVAITDRDGALEVRVGPLQPGKGREMLERGDLPGLGNALERLARDVALEEAETDDGPAEYLTLEVRE